MAKIGEKIKEAVGAVDNLSKFKKFSMSLHRMAAVQAMRPTLTSYMIQDRMLKILIRIKKRKLLQT
jgi:hypothetical protein